MANLLFLQPSIQLYLILLLCILTSSSWNSHHVPALAEAEKVLGGEKAFFTVPQMSPEVDYRQDVCDRYSAFRNGTFELKDALKGMKLNVLMGAYNGSYFNYDDENGIDAAYPGIAAKLMDEIALRAGFTWRSSFGVFTDPKGADFNETWTDVLLWGVENYDLNVDWWASNVARLNSGVAYTLPWYDSSIILVGKEESDEFIDEDLEWGDFWNWKKPFTVEVWVTIYATIVLSALVYMLLEWLNGDIDGRTTWEWLTQNLYLSGMNATQAYEYGTPKSLAGQIFGGSMSLWALILTATYTANLASLLIRRSDTENLVVIESMEEAAVFGFPVCTVAETNADIFIRETFPSAIRRPTASLKDLYEGVNSGQCAFAADVVQSWLSNKNKRKFNRNCDLEWIGDGRLVAQNSAGFATLADAGFKCTGLIRDVINFHMAEMIADGSLDDAWEFENRRYQDVDCETFRPELLDELNAVEGNDATRRRNLLDKQQQQQQDVSSYHRPRRPKNASRRRNLLDKQQQDDSSYRRPRQLKASSRAAASSAAVLGGEETEQMELDAMMGSFFIHYALMGLAILIAIGKNMYKKYAIRRATESKKLHPFAIDDTKMHTIDMDTTDKLHTSFTKKHQSFGIMKGRLNEDLEVVSTSDGMPRDEMLTDGSSSLQSQIEQLKYSFEASECARTRENQNLQGKIDLMIQENQGLREQIASLIGELQKTDETRVRHA